MALQFSSPAWFTVFASLALSLIGIYCIDVAEVVRPFPLWPLSPTAFKQLIFLAIGIGAATFCVIPNYRWLEYLVVPLVIVSGGLLIFLLLPFVPTWLVKPRHGARGWIDLGAFDMQPSEIAKIAVVITLASYLKFRNSYRTFRGLVPPAIIVGIPVALITLQPDLGSASLFVPMLFAVLVAAGAKLRHLLIVVIAAACMAPAAYPLLKNHQKQRIVGLWKQFQGDTTADLDINMQAVTAQRLIGAGGMGGLSDSHSRSLLHFNNLPERHNDMIFAVIVNRFGMAGGLAVIGLFLLWTLGAFATAAGAKDPFGRLLVVGLAAFIPAQVFVNIGMNLGLLPIIGITLPFISYGGSSLVICWIITGLILNTGLRKPRTQFKEAFEFAEDE